MAPKPKRSKKGPDTGAREADGNTTVLAGNRQSGKVKWFKGSYGFITREGEPDLFVHHTAILGDGFRTLKSEEQVTFEVVQGERGPQADKVSRA